MRRATLVALGSACALSLGIAGCGGDEETGGSGASGGGEQEQVTVGLITKTETNPFFVKMREAAADAAKANDVELITAAGKFDGDNASQVTAMENMIARGVKGILIVPSDSKAITAAMEKAKAQGITVIALDTPPEPEEAADALFATDNAKAGELIGRYAKAKVGDEPRKIAMLDLSPGISVGVLRHDGFLKGYGIEEGDPQIVGSAMTQGDRAKGQAGMETLLQKDPDVDLVYSINEPSGLGGYRALQAAGKAQDAMVVSIDGGCEGVREVKAGKLAATSMQFPRRMAEMGVKAVAEAARGGQKPSGYTDTGVELITDDPVEGIPSKDTAWGLENCWG